jgi:hypothetical protein
VQRWALILAEFDFTTEYAPGETNFLADFISRALAREPTEPMPLLQVCASRSGRLSERKDRKEEGEGTGALASLVRSLPHSIAEDGTIVLHNPHRNK